MVYFQTHFTSNEIFRALIGNYNSSLFVMLNASLMFQHALGKQC